MSSQYRDPVYAEVERLKKENLELEYALSRELALKADFNAKSPKSEAVGQSERFVISASDWRRYTAELMIVTLLATSHHFVLAVVAPSIFLAADFLITKFVKRKRETFSE